MTDPDVDPVRLRAVAEQLAAEAMMFVRRRRAEVFAVGDDTAGAAPQRENSGTAVRAKSTPTDPVTIVDTETERLLRDRLARLRPGEAVLGEEEGFDGAERDDAGGDTAAGVTWVLDPIDGTVNFVYGLPAYAVSVGAQIDGVSVAGAVAHVAADAVYSAALGHGARRRDAAGLRALRCSVVGDLSMALVGTGFGYSPALRRRQAEVLARLLPVVRDMRRMGSAALDLCLVADGSLDAYYEENLKVWDWAAGALIAAEAGAALTLPAPAGPGDGAGLLVAAAPDIAAELRAALGEFGAGSPA